MVIHQLDAVGVAVLPIKTETPLIGDPDAPLAFAIAPKLLQTATRQSAEVAECHCGVEHPQLSETRFLQIGAPAADLLAVVEALSFLAAEAPDHSG